MDFVEKLKTYKPSYRFSITLYNSDIGVCQVFTLSEKSLQHKLILEIICVNLVTNFSSKLKVNREREDETTFIFY